MMPSPNTLLSLVFQFPDWPLVPVLVPRRNRFWRHTGAMQDIAVTERLSGHKLRLEPVPA
jgi:hypothetical protein